MSTRVGLAFEVEMYKLLYKQLVGLQGLTHKDNGPSATQVESFEKATPEQREQTLRWLSRGVGA